MNKVDLSIVIPIYNEQESLLELYNQIQEALNNQFIGKVKTVNYNAKNTSEYKTDELSSEVTFNFSIQIVMSIYITGELMCQGTMRRKIVSHTET